MTGLQIQYRIANLHEKRFFLQDAPSLTAETIRAETTYNVGVDVSLERETNHIIIAFDLRLFPKTQEEITLLHYAASMSFEVYGFEMMFEGVDRPSVPTALVQPLLAATYSTFRGIIYARCGGSLLREAILPLADSRSFLNEEAITTGPLVVKDLPEIE